MQQSVIHFRQGPSGLNPAVEKYGISTTDEVDAYLADGCVIALGVSGGKDGSSMACRVAEHLDAIGHNGPRVLVHSDLGRVEWKQSIEICQRLSDRLGYELILVKRPAGDLMQRWESRWENNIARYSNLECVKLILPWSTPSMRFCTSEMKTQLICAELTRRFPGQKILSLTGIRRSESSARAKMPVASKQEKLSARKCTGLNWNPIIDWPTDHVYEYLADKPELLHEAYSQYGSTRVSCAFCIMGSINDLKASASCEDHADIYRLMVDLEIKSTYAFQGDRWLADVAPHLLSDDVKQSVIEAKRKAAARMEIEAEIPKHLLYTSGWPDSAPSYSDAALLASVRARIAGLMGIDVDYTTPEAIIARYEALIAIKSTKDAKKLKASSC